MEENIKGIVPHILSFVINELCKNGFLIAFEKDLSDLKGLIEPDSLSSDDFELLDSVDDDVVRILLKSIDRVVKCSKTYFLINNLDELEVMENEEYNVLASESSYTYIIDWESLSYQDVLENLNAVYFSISQLLYYTTCQIRLNEIEPPNEVNDEFLDRYSDLLGEKLYSEDKNISLIYDLIVDLNIDLCDIDKLSD